MNLDSDTKSMNPTNPNPNLDILNFSDIHLIPKNNSKKNYVYFDVYEIEYGVSGRS